MIKEAIATGSTVDDAKEAAVALLNAGIDDEVKFEIIDLPQKKTFGLFGGCPAKVRAYVEIEDETKNVTPEPVRVKENKPRQEKKNKNTDSAKKEPVKEDFADKEEVLFEKKPITDPVKQAAADRATSYLKKILGAMKIDAEISVSDYDGGIEMTLDGDEIGSIVGRRGETLDALQYLSVLAANSNEDTYQRVLLNTGDYRNKRQKVLQALAKRIASQALKNGKNIALEPMNPYERRIIHMTIHEMDGISSWSIGSEPYRRVVIGTSKEGKITYNNRREGRNDRRSGGYNNSRSGGGRTYQQRRQSSNNSVEREVKKDMDAAPLYGRIDI